MNEENQSPDQQPEKNFVDKIGMLTKNNQRRFGKLLDKFEKGYSSLEGEKEILQQEKEKLLKEIDDLKSAEKIEKRELISEYELAYNEYSKAQTDSEQIKTELYPHSSSMSSYGSEIIWFSVIIGLVFDFLLWKDIFAGKFGEDIWAERAERASAVIMSFSYAFICAQLGAAYAIKTLVRKRKNSFNISEKEKEVYNKSTAKESLGINIILFFLLTLLSTAARFTQEKLDLSDKFILSLAATTIGLVISAVAYWYTDVYDHFIKAAKNREQWARKNFMKISKKVDKKI